MWWARYGRLDCAFNNAGATGIGPLETLDKPLWDTIIDTNLKAQFFCLKAQAAQMKKQGNGGIDCVHRFGPGQHRPAWNQYLKRQQGRHRLPCACSGGRTRIVRHPCKFHQPVDHLHRDDARLYCQERRRVGIAPLCDRRTARPFSGAGGNGTGRPVPAVGPRILRQRPSLDRGWRQSASLPRGS
jgi:hypothetical protein